MKYFYIIRGGKFLKVNVFYICLYNFYDEYRVRCIRRDI